MIELTHPVSGHTVRTDSESVGFWRVAGYREQQPKPVKKAAAAKRSSSKK